MIIVTWLLGAPLVHAQAIRGTLLDEITGEPVVFAHLTLKNSSIGTISNQEGAYQLQAMAGTDSVVISHIGYQTMVTVVKDQETLYLKPNLVVLQEVTFTDQSYARELAEEVLQMLANAKNHYGRAFYRQVSQHDTIFTEFAEGFYDLSFSARGLEMNRLKQARFARKVSDSIPFMRFSNFDYISTGMNLYSKKSQAESNTLGKPFSQAFFERYDFRFESQWLKGKDSLVAVAFIPGPDISQPALSGSLIFNLSQKRLRQMELFINHSLGSGKIRTSIDTLKISMEEPRFHWTLVYREDRPLLDYILVDFTYQLAYNGITAPCRIFSHFSIFEYLDKKPRKLAIADVNKRHALHKAKYQPRFWKDNPMVSRTSDEEAIIRSFEKDNSFGSYFK